MLIAFLWIDGGLATSHSTPFWRGKITTGKITFYHQTAALCSAHIVFGIQVLRHPFLPENGNGLISLTIA